MDRRQQAFRMILEIESELTRANGQLQQARQARFLKVLEALLEFKSEESARKWLARECKDCGELLLHHVNSAHSTLHLMKEIDAARVFRRGDRVVWIETGETGTVSQQWIDGYVSLTLDDGSPAELYASSLKKIESGQHRAQNKKRKNG